MTWTPAGGFQGVGGQERLPAEVDLHGDDRCRLDRQGIDRRHNGVELEGIGGLEHDGGQRRARGQTLKLRDQALEQALLRSPG